MSSLFNLPWQQAFDSSGNTLAGAKLYFYVAGTSTPQNAYADIGLGVPLSNPVIANGAGRFVPIFLADTAYKVMLYDADDNLIWSADNIYNQSIDADASVALAAIRTTTTSAGYPVEDQDDPTKFVESIYKYANAANWYEDTGANDNEYILTGVDNYTRPNDYFEGQHIWFISSRANTGASTVNVLSKGQKNIFRADGSALEAGDILGMVHLVYNGTSFLLQDNGYVELFGDQIINGVKTYTSSPNLPTPASSDNSTKAATTAFVSSKLSPNISSRVTITSSIGTSNGFTAPSNGFITAESTTGEATVKLIIGEYIVAQAYNYNGDSHGNQQTFLCCPIGRGQTVRYTRNSTAVDPALAYFIPYA